MLVFTYETTDHIENSRSMLNNNTRHITFYCFTQKCACEPALVHLDGGGYTCTRYRGQVQAHVSCVNPTVAAQPLLKA